MADDDLPDDETAAKAEPLRLKSDDPEAFISEHRSRLNAHVHQWSLHRAALLRERSGKLAKGTLSKAEQKYQLEMIINAARALDCQAQLAGNEVQAAVFLFAADLIRDGLRNNFPKFPDVDLSEQLPKQGRLSTAQRNAISIADAIIRVFYRPNPNKEDVLIPEFHALKIACELFGLNEEQLNNYRRDYAQDNGALEAIKEHLRRMAPDDRPVWAEMELRKAARDFSAATWSPKSVTGAKKP